MPLTISKEVPGMPDNYKVKLTFNDGTVEDLTVVKHQLVSALIAEIVPVKDKDGKTMRQIMKWNEVDTGDIEFLTVENRWIVFHRSDIKKTEYGENFSVFLDLQAKHAKIPPKK